MIDLKQKSIVACCTAKGAAAAALIRISGHDAFEVVKKISRFPAKKTIFDFESHVVRYGRVVDSQTTLVIDEVLFLIMRGPKTFTGFDTVEITCHGNPIIVQKIIDAAVVAGARIADRGEFTRQAVENEKIDLVQAEAIHELVVAQNEVAVDRALAQVDGSLSKKISEIEEQIVRLLAFVEASFEFVEEEHEDLGYAHLVKKEYDAVCDSVSTLVVNCDRQNHLKNGFRVVCVGSVNAGKSTLFNRLVGANRSIVTNVAGTTRDVVDATVVKDGALVTFVDTAGIRESFDVVEQIGIERSLSEIARADLVVLVVDVTRKISAEEDELYARLSRESCNKLLVVKNKIDSAIDYDVLARLNILFPVVHVSVSALSGQGVNELWKQIQDVVQLCMIEESPFLLNERHKNILLSVQQSLTVVGDYLYPHQQFELAAAQLHELLEIFSRMTGRNVAEKVLDQVFSSFCLGK
ncbi:tRNA uridine-5-carboxymethylaminomethyl(34) synthesis GTPase MnmE [Candidatus Dependentiae bacterium]|nr:tRNA uridine-5-carboxymethylaminomethyl(34) synthesis GTPase MnmE [Candidatus Dependentiae bacterium]